MTGKHQVRSPLFFGKEPHRNEQWINDDQLFFFDFPFISFMDSDFGSLENHQKGLASVFGPDELHLGLDRAVLRSGLGHKMKDDR